MAILGIGSDIVDVSRIQRLYDRYGERFLKRIYTKGERVYCESKSQPAIHFAGRFAAKEAVAKAAYQSGYNQVIPFPDIEILNDTEGRPQVSLLSHIQGKCLVTISHEQSMAIAFALLEG
jgi:holo-[acyl-carrier protein] synthase